MITTFLSHVSIRCIVFLSKVLKAPPLQCQKFNAVHLASRGCVGSTSGYRRPSGAVLGGRSAGHKQ